MTRRIRRSTLLFLFLFTFLSLGYGVSASAQVSDQGPSFDCGKASGTVQKLICSNPDLAQLDRELADIFGRALVNLPESERPTARAYQRGWIKGRDECWKAQDVATCVRDEYERRITELQILGGLVEVPSPVGFKCDDGGQLTVTYYANTKKSAAVLTFNDAQAIAFQQPTASGTLYLGRNVRLREHQGDVQLEWNGEARACKAAHPMSSSVEPCAGLPASAAMVVVRSPLSGASVKRSFEVSGCSRTFEGTVTWRLVSARGQTVASGHTTGGSVDGPAPFHFTVKAGGAAPGLYSLIVDEPKTTDEGFPPPRTELPIVLTR